MFQIGSSRSLWRARRQCLTLGRHALDLAVQFHLLLKQGVARPAILRALIGKVNVLNGLRSGFCERSHVHFLRALTA
jgi:hypothetical protein